MLDIRFVREHPDEVKENIKKKVQDAKLPLVDEGINLDAEYRAAIGEGDTLRANRNKLSKQIGMLLGLVLLVSYFVMLKLAPAECLSSRLLSLYLVGRRSLEGSSDSEYWVFAMQIGSLSCPSFSILAIDLRASEE